MQKGTQIATTGLGVITAAALAYEQRRIVELLRAVESSLGIAIEQLIDVNNATQTIVARLGPPPRDTTHATDADPGNDTDDAPVIPLQQDPHTARPHDPDMRRVANDWARFP